MHQFWYRFSWVSQQLSSQPLAHAKRVCMSDMRTITTGNSAGRHKIKQWTGKNGTTQTSFLATAAFYFHTFTATWRRCQLHVCAFMLHICKHYILCMCCLLLYSLLVAFSTRVSAKLPIVTKHILWQIPPCTQSTSAHSPTPTPTPTPKHPRLATKVIQ